MKRKFAGVIVRNQEHFVIRSAGQLLAKIGLKDEVSKYLFRPRRKWKARVSPSTARGSEADRVRDYLNSVSQLSGPIVVGPWLSEVGFELLYWIPFLRWATAAYRIDPDRVTVVSRGGVSSWYSGIGKQYVDIFEAFTPEEFRALNEARWQGNFGLQKHTTMNSFDRHILERVGVSPNAALLHPELMYGLFDDYWTGNGGFELIAAHTRFSRLKAPQLKHSILNDLPDKFDAVKFYTRPSFPMTDETAKFVERFALQLAERRTVLFLNTRVNVDDHGEFAIPKHTNIIALSDGLNATDNLAVQSAVIAKASRVYCTYGGFAYLPMMYGVPAIGFFAVDKHFLKIHARVAFALASQMQTSLSVVEAGALE